MATAIGLGHTVTVSEEIVKEAAEHVQAIAENKTAIEGAEWGIAMMERNISGREKREVALQELMEFLPAPPPPTKPQ